MADNNNKGKKGFSGLSDLASEISDINESIKPEPKEANPSTTKQPHQPQREVDLSKPDQKTTSPNPPVETANSGKSGGSSSGKWLLGIIGIIFVIWLINNAEQSNKKPSYTPPSSSQNYSYQQSTSVPAIQTSSTTQSIGLQCTKPSIGTNNVLSVSKIRWCLREGIRIEAMRDVIDNNAGINEFNRIVDDYNSRCASYRYRQGSRSRAEHDVETYRSQIVSEAIRKAKQLGHSYQHSSPSISPNVSTSNAPKKPNAQYTREAQQILKDLGYAPGPVDGNYGRRTANAVKAFQRDAGIIQNGWIDKDLLSTLRTTREKLLKTKATSENYPAKKPPVPTTKPSEQLLLATKGTISVSERARIENYCERMTSTSANKDDCIERELKALRELGGKPDLSNISQTERQQIESYCSRFTSTPGDEYNCIFRELKTLRQSGEKPDLSSNAQYTREAQQLLTDLGYAPGPVDGDYGHRTADAVKAFQRNTGITQDGGIDEDLLNTLRKAKAAYNPPVVSQPKPQPQTILQPYSNTFSSTNKTTSYFTRNSHQNDVLKVQGTPDDIIIYSTLGYEEWKYEYSSVKISTRNRRVISWKNDGNLKVKLLPGKNTSNTTYFTRNSHQDDVLMVQGTPDDIIIYSTLGYEEWKYEYSSVKISTRNRRVISWKNDGNLKVKLLPEKNTSNTTYFTRNSHQDNVLMVQGTPDDIIIYSTLGYEEWKYGYSSVKISTRNRRVISWKNDGNLKVKLLPGKNTSNTTYFTRNSHQDDVLMVQGTPDDIIIYSTLGYEEWKYGYSSVKISTRNRRVISWKNDGNLKVK